MMLVWFVRKNAKQYGPSVQSIETEVVQTRKVNKFKVVT